MKLLYTVIFVLEVLQLVRTKPLETTTSNNILSPEKELVGYYNKKFNLLTGDICLQLKNVTQEILKDPIVEQAASPFMQEFKTNISNFQKISPFYMRFGLNETLTWTFSNMVKDYYYTPHSNNKDAVYIAQLLRTLGYEGLREKYKNDFKKFITEEFVPKFEELKDQISEKSQLTKFESKFLKCVNTLRECEEYECYLNTFKANTLTPRDKLYGSLQRQMIDVTILHLRNATAYFRGWLNDPKLAQLSPAVKQQVNKNINKSVEIYEGMDNIQQICNIAAFYPVLLFERDTAQKIASEDLQLLENIVKDFVMGDLNSYVKRIYGEFVEHDVSKLIEYYRPFLSQGESTKDKHLLNTLDRLKGAKRFEQKLELLKNLNILEEEEFQKYRI